MTDPNSVYGEANKASILVVDDKASNIDILDNILRKEYLVKVALSGEKALEIANSQPQPDLILLDVMMPNMNGFEVMHFLQNNPLTAHIPVIFVTGNNQLSDEEKGLNLGAVDYITKPISPSIVSARIKTHLTLNSQNKVLALKVKERTKELEDSQLEIVQSLSRAAEFKDNETGLHIVRMSHFSRILAKGLNIEDGWVELLFITAPMHDVGKIGIPDKILLKPGKLDLNEWELMMKHTSFGMQILGGNQSDLLKLANEIAGNHHEKYDGTGYPNGLAGENIPLSSRIVAIADVFDALTSERPYKKAWSIERAVEHIREQSGKHFDPKLVKVFDECLSEILEIQEYYKEGKN